MTRLFFVSLILILSMTTGSQAQITKKFCVNCKSPDKTYLCSIKSEGLANNTALGLHCVVKLSTTRSHQSCTVSKVEPEICEGKKVSFNYKEDNDKTTAGNSRILPGGSQAQDRQDNAGEKRSYNRDQTRKAKVRKRKKEPETLIEFTDKVADDTGKALKKTGKAISKATKKTFKCIGSLFSKC